MTEENPASKKVTKKKTAKKAALKKTVKTKASEHTGDASEAPEQEKQSAPVIESREPSEQAGGAAAEQGEQGVAGVERRKPIKDRRADDKVMPGLLRNLEGVFDKIHSDNIDRDRTQEQIAEDFSAHMQHTFDEMHGQLEEREQLLDAKLKGIDRAHSNQLTRVKLMSIPVAFLSLIAVVYLFYVVHVMETAMTSMSTDMHQITSYMDIMRTDTHAMSYNTANMNKHMEVMNNNIGNMNANVYNMDANMNNMNANLNDMNANMNNLAVDMHHMSRSVSPTMTNMNRFMP